MAKRGPKPRVDWDAIEVEIEFDTEPNPQNPYARLSEQAREQAIVRLYEKIYLRILSEELQ